MLTPMTDFESEITRVVRASMEIESMIHKGRSLQSGAISIVEQ